MKPDHTSKHATQGDATSPISGMALRYAAVTDVGRVRSTNEDAYDVMPEQPVFIVADGMGGHAAGDVASSTAVQTMTMFFRETTDVPADVIRWPFPVDEGMPLEERRLVTAVKLANKFVHQASLDDPSKRGMGTTITALTFSPSGVHWANVGDSRIYRMRGERLTQLTTDHSLLNAHLQRRQFAGEEERQEFIANFPHKNVLVRALGVHHDVSVDVDRDEVRPGDLYLLCSDGIHGLLSDDRIAEVLLRHRRDLQRCADELVEAANRLGGNDNSTVVLVESLRL